MTFLFFWRSPSHRKKKYQNVHGNSSAGPYFGHHAGAQADLSMAIDGRPNAVLIPSLDCSHNGSEWTNFANFCKVSQNFQQAIVGLFWASF